MIFRRKPNKDDGHNTGADRYLITYADLITLLLGLFVVLYGSAQVDQEKFKDFSAAFSDFFKAKDDKVLQGGDGVLQGHKKGVPEPILPPMTQKSLNDVTSEMENSLQSFISSGNIELLRQDSMLKINLSERLLFKSGKAELEPGGLSAIDSISKVLKNTSMTIYVDGHTDIVPIRTFQYESNWHLSAARATNVAYKMIKDGVPEFNLTIRGFGSQRPAADNTTEEGKMKNRRVEILLVAPSSESPTQNGYINTDTIMKN